MPLTITYSLTTVAAEFRVNDVIAGDEALQDVSAESGGLFAIDYGSPAADSSWVNHLVGGISSPEYDVTGGSVELGNAVGTELADGDTVWVDSETNPKSYGHEFYFSSLGNISLSHVLLNAGGSEYSYLSDVTGLAGGGFVVVWQEGYSGGPSHTGVVATIGDNNGADGGDIQVGTLHANEGSSKVAGLTDGGFVVVFTDDSEGKIELRARLYDKDGNPRAVDAPADGTGIPTSNDFLVASSQHGDNKDPALAALPNGNFAFAYVDTGWVSGADDEGGSSGITLTVMRPDGSYVLNYTHVNVASPGVDESAPSIAVLPNGFIVVSWTAVSQSHPDDHDIRYRIFDEAGNAVTGQGAFQSSSADERNGMVASTISGQFVAAWEDSQTPGDSDGYGISATIQELVRHISGDAANNRGATALIGDELRDILDGKGGADTMRGKGGNDVYYVDNAGDVVDESGGDGRDLVKASISFDLSNSVRVKGDVEDLTLTGNGNTHATGNALANVLRGNDGNNVLDGKGGADTMYGGHGRDTYLVDDSHDVVFEQFDDQDVDLVKSTISFSLVPGAHAAVRGSVENLTLTGSGNINATGNDLRNLLTGNDGRNTLDGRGGADHMIGGGANDVYIVDNAGDVVDETGGSGDDLVKAGVSFSLASANHAKGSVEKLQLIGSGDINGTGNQLDNVILGNGGSNILKGGDGADKLTGAAGNDTLAGQGGNDRFVFDTGFGKDTVTDFATGDKLVFSKAVFTDYNDAKANATVQDGHVVIAYDANDQVTITTLHKVSDLHSGDFAFV